jgi:hypothetical protein
MALNLVTGLLLLVVPLLFNGTFLLLQRTFDYPDILRQPTDVVLRRFKAGGAPLRRLWYVFALSAVLFTPVAVLVHQLLGARAPWYLAAGTTLGVLAGVVQFLGLLRWPFLVNTLADLYTDPQATPATRDSVAVVFQAFHRYAGVALGEHLGYLFTGGWTLLLCAAIISTGVVSPVLGWLGLLPALGVLAGVLEEVGVKPAAVINAISYLLWSVWVMALGVAVLLLR